MFVRKHNQLSHLPSHKDIIIIGIIEERYSNSNIT